ncbi:hypothetical protein NA56DRAFT_666328 [Hyaloscypha hepaticicola]|uniref:Amidohydrolase-related domain-containing protein n=1 Tax=Hyaloscypha hepaticicola TaxID=2082293 RepID=A0A2J6PEU1_9HELO|nr:hypothetical protein NA56DRAFT_666328 [Hyaloscypha hepaticicola]
MAHMLLFGLAFICCSTKARKWNNTDTGSIIFEEAVSLPNLRPNTSHLNNTIRFGAFAAFSMHNATAAGVELRRAVTELGFLGALVNDYQQSGADNATLLYYDEPQYDAFWSVVQELDVPHPINFAVMLSNHIVGLCANGVFDRFPNLKVIVGHLGERIPSDFWRIDEMLARKVGIGMPMNKTFSSYWKPNIYETTSGNFATDLLNFHASLIGADHILYSVDYPFVMMEQGQEWVGTLRISPFEKWNFIRGNAILLLGLVPFQKPEKPILVLEVRKRGQEPFT